MQRCWEDVMLLYALFVAVLHVDTGFVNRQPRPQYGGPPSNFNPNFYQPQQQQAPPPFQMFYQGMSLIH